jgi:prophage antirepressor-like protein
LGFGGIKINASCKGAKPEKMMPNTHAIVLFKEKEIRRIWHQGEWWFSVIDVVGALSESLDAGAYWRKLKQRLKKERSEVVTFCHGLKLVAPDGKKYTTDCANTESLLRIIQSVPSPKAEPFKRWLSKVGYERIQEIENPELSQERMKQIYEQKDYAILTAEIAKATFGMTPSEYKAHKNLPAKSKANLRDHMTDLELIFTMLGERVTTEISATEKPDTFDGSRRVAKRGGTVAGVARKEAEKEWGRSITSKENYLSHSEMKSVIRAQKKSIGSDSEVGKGTTFRLWVPD